MQEYVLQTFDTSKAQRYRREVCVKVQYLINGLTESNLPIITAEEPDAINFSIWGLLPDEYLDDWEKFQETSNTLNVNLSEVMSKQIPVLSFKEPKRCLIIVSGFFTNVIHEGQFKTYHIHLKEHEPFALAGVYNTLKDGFFTCAPIIIEQKKSINKLPSYNGMKPFVLRPEDFKDWLDPSLEMQNLRTFIDNHRSHNFLSHPIEAEFYHNDAIFSELSENVELKLIR